MSDSPFRVVVAALTYRRPDDLAALLPALLDQAARSAESVEVLIVDNDPDGGARRQVEDVGGPVSYLHVPEPGIAAARNGALTAADEADLLVFIDDDERPVEAWLDRLVAVWRQERCAAVIGPVVSAFAVEPSAWIRAGRFFERRRMPTGSETDVAATNNLLLDMSVVRRLGLRFDLRFGLIGGSDTLFTRTLARRGGRMVWCDEAVVQDVVPSSRATRTWVLRRAYRSGNSDALTRLVLASGRGARMATRAQLLVRGAARVVAGVAQGVLGGLSGDLVRRAGGARTAARGRGMLAGAVGSSYEEYARA